MNPILQEISKLINQQYGLEFHAQRMGLLAEAVQKRMAVNNVSTEDEYLQLLQQQKEEVVQLIHLLTVHETYFFREPIHFEVLTMQVIPRLLKNGASYPFLRFLSAGCSTGEEAYSLAIAALKVPGVGINWDFEVVGFDVNEHAIQKARAGLYGSYSFRSCPQEVRDSCFEYISPESFLIKNFIKEKVRFETLNLFEELYPDWIQNIDSVFYRNVSIYFSKSQREAIFQRLSCLLNQEGTLFLSCTETLDHNNHTKMALVKESDTFYYQKQNSTALARENIVAKTITAIARPRQSIVSQLKKRPVKLETQRIDTDSLRSKHQSATGKLVRGQVLFVDALESVKHKRYEEALRCLDEIIAADVLFVKAYTLKANILLSQQHVEKAIELCQAALALDAFCLEAYLLLGMAARTSGENMEAMRRFKEAVYVYPDCWLAHFYLAEMHQLQEENVPAKREYEVAMRILKQGNFENHGLSFFLVAFQPGDFIQLCQHNIAILEQ